MSKRLRLGPFARNVGILASGTGLSQIIPIVATPILSRMYTPTEFGVLAVFVSLFTVLGVFASGRYELAILHPDKDEDAATVAALGLTLGGILSAISFVVIWFGRSTLAGVLGVSGMENWLLLVPPVMLASSAYNSLKFLANRQQAYGRIARAEVAKTLFAAIPQLLLGAVGFGAGALPLGQAIGHIASVAPLSRAISKYELGRAFRPAHLARVAIRFKKFPLLSLPAALANTLSTHLTNVLVANRYSVDLLGQYSMAQRLLGIPSATIGTAVGQVYYREAMEERRLSGKSIRAFKHTSAVLALISIPGFALAALVAPSLFVFVLGDQWEFAGELARYMIPLFAIRFIVAGVSMATSVHERQGLALLWQLGLLAIAVGAILITPALGLGITQFAIIYSALSSMHYLLLYAVMWRISSRGDCGQLG